MRRIIRHTRDSSSAVSTYGILLIAVLIVSFSAIFIRWAAEVPAVVLSFYRLIISSGILLLYHRLRKRRFDSGQSSFHWHFILAGIFLALHFITWISALKLTTIANAIFLGSTHPFFAVIISIIALSEAPIRKSIPVFIFAFLGMLLIVAADFDPGSSKLLGDVTAIFSALFFALYILFARLHRHRGNLILYLGMVYGIAGLLCLIIGLFQQAHLTGFSYLSWVMIFLLALGPSLLGHSLLNWVSQRIEIYKVNLAMLLEPVLATIAGMILFIEYPGHNFYPGAILIILSLGYLIYLEKKR